MRSAAYLNEDSIGASTRCAPATRRRSWSGAVSLAMRLVMSAALLAIIIQAAIRSSAPDPQYLITGAYGMADIIRPRMPPRSARSDTGMVDGASRPSILFPGIFGTVGDVIMALRSRLSRPPMWTPSRFALLHRRAA